MVCNQSNLSTLPASSGGTTKVRIISDTSNETADFLPRRLFDTRPAAARRPGTPGRNTGKERRRRRIAAARPAPRKMPSRKMPSRKMPPGKRLPENALPENAAGGSLKGSARAAFLPQSLSAPTWRWPKAVRWSSAPPRRSRRRSPCAAPRSPRRTSYGRCRRHPE